MSIASTADVMREDLSGSESTLLLGTAEAEVVRLAEVLGHPITAVPSFSGGSEAWTWSGELDTWRAGLVRGAVVDRVVVAAWSPLVAARALVDIPIDAWVDQAEAPLAVWVAALGVAAARVRDGGCIVAVAERPSPLDCATRAAEGAVADGVEALVRSLARSEGPRGVRVNLVTTPLRLAPPDPVAPAPSLATFPGSVETELAGAVRLLTGSGTDGLTGTVVHADCGRSWR
jgi:NAD(P)-dependent dehydrogenase (short-subunit alcohol dehydrogenase family)